MEQNEEEKEGESYQYTYKPQPREQVHVNAYVNSPAEKERQSSVPSETHQQPSRQHTQTSKPASQRLGYSPQSSGIGSQSKVAQSEERLQDQKQPSDYAQPFEEKSKSQQFEEKPKSQQFQENEPTSRSREQRLQTFAPKAQSEQRLDPYESRYLSADHFREPEDPKANIIGHTYQEPSRSESGFKKFRIYPGMPEEIKRIIEELNSQADASNNNSFTYTPGDVSTKIYNPSDFRTDPAAGMKASVSGLGLKESVVKDYSGKDYSLGRGYQDPLMNYDYDLHSFNPKNDFNPNNASYYSALDYPVRSSPYHEKSHQYGGDVDLSYLLQSPAGGEEAARYFESRNRKKSPESPSKSVLLMHLEKE